MTDIYNTNIFTKGTVTYSDIDLNFKTNPVTDDIRLKTDAEAIKQSIKNILYTNTGEKPFRPEFFGGINDLLFEPLDTITTEVMEARIITILQNYEPRIRVVSVKVTGKPDENSVELTIKFNMLNVLEPQNISILLRRTR